MNKHLYRLVFNRALGVLQVVAEIARAMRGAGRGTAGTGRAAASTPLAAALALALGALPAIAAPPGIAPDRGAAREHRPTVLVAPSGAPAINITTPSAAGVSRNAYSRFDVDPRGAILNNSRTRVQSEVGGWLPGNPWLARGTARVILNEVNGSEPSHLAGLVEVAGDRAQVVIANPAGIQADGVGFINANGVVLTTGRPQLGGDGSLAAYRVTGGTIEIGGQGMNALGSGYAQLIARAVALNAAVHAERATLSLGGGVVAADGGASQALAGEGPAPEFALDVGALGGMYANKIRLVGNEHGVGMRNAGVIGAQAGEVVVTVDGRVENTGSVQAAGDVRVAAAALHNGGTILAGSDRADAGVVLEVAGTLDNAGTVQASGDVRLRGAALRNAGLVHAGGGQATGAAKLEASDRLDNHGNIQAIDAVRMSAGTLRNAGTIAAGRQVALRTPGALDNRDGRIEAPRLDLDTGSLLNRGGRIAQTSQHGLALGAGQLSNREGGRIGAAPPPPADAATPAPAAPTPGAPPSGDNAIAPPAPATTGGAPATPVAPLADGRLQVAGLLDNDGGTIEAARLGLALSGDSLDNSGGHLSLESLQLAGGALRNAGGSLRVAGDTRLDLGRIDNRDGELMFAAALDVRADEFLNRGGRFSHAGEGATRLQVGGLLDNDRGWIASNASRLSLSAARLTNRDGDLVHAGSGTLSLALQALLGQDGRIAGNGALVLWAGDVDHRGASLGAKRLDVQASNFDNRGGKLQASGAQASTLWVDEHLDNRDGGRIGGNGDLSLRTARFDNAGGVVEHAGSGTLAVSADQLAGDGGRLGSLGTLRLQGGALSLRGAQTFAQQIDLDADTLDHAAGQLSSLGQGQARLRVRQRLGNEGGTLAGNGTLWLRAGQLDNRAGTVQFLSGDAHHVQSDAGLDNTGGRLLGGGALTVASNTLDNGGGLIATFDPGQAGEAARADALAVRVGGLARNAGGTLSSSGTLDLQSARLDNHGGKIEAQHALAVEAGEGVDNQRGRLAGATLALRAGAVDNRAGLLGSTQGGLEIESDAFDNRGGRVQSADALTLDTRGHALDNRSSGDSGGLRAAGTMALETGEVDNRGGTISAAQATMRATAVDNRDGGLLSATGALSLQADTLRNGGGIVQGGERTGLQLAQLLDNRAGLVASGGLLDIQARQLDNRDTRQGEMPLGLQAGAVQVRGDTLDNGNGLVIAASTASAGTEDPADAEPASGADARFTLAGALDNTGGVVSAGDRLVMDADALHNADGLLHAGRSQELDMRVLDGAGRLESRGDARVHVRGDLDHSGAMAANGQLTVVADGQLTQRGQLNGGAVAVQARRIDNTASGEIGSQGLTRLEAGEWIRNRGLVDGATTSLVAPEVDNPGSGRVYGDHVAISATTLRNHDETLDGRTQSGTIAARQRLDLGVQALHNSGQALIHSGGSAGVGGALDDARKATGTAARIENVGATIDIVGKLDLRARELHNERPGVRVESQARQDAQVRLDQPTWRHNGQNGTRNIRATSNYQAWEVYYLDPADILEDAPYYTPDGQRIGRAVVRLTPRTSAFFFERGGLHAALGARDRLPAADGTVTIYYMARQDGQDNPDQVAPGQRDPFAHLTTISTKPGERPPTFQYLDEAPDWSDAYGTCRSGCVQLTAQYHYDPERDLINPKGAGNNKLSGNEQYRTARRQVIEDVVTHAGPDAVLQSGGDMHLAVGKLTNLHGRLLAGGVQKIDGLDGAPPVIDNRATTLYRTWSFDVTHHRYDGSTAPGDSSPVSEVIGSVGAMMGGGQRLDIDGSGLRNLDDGREAPNLRNDLGTSNLPGAGRGGAPLPGHQGAGAPTTFNAPHFVAAADGSADQVAAGSVDGRLPTASLFRPAGAGSAWLVQADPRFSGPRDWPSSEHQLLALGYNPADLHKRLGDGYYEQGLVRDQVSQLTGRRFLDGHASDEEQFRALLENGATFARQFGLRPGLALTEAQMAALTSDIVWLVEQTITLPDGSTTTALVPRVYVRLRSGDLRPSGAVLAADVVKTNLVGDLLNNGTIHGRQLVDLTARDLNNVGGAITGGFVGLDATRDINNIGGAIRAEHGLVAVAGNDINQVSTTRSESAGNGDNGYARTTLDRLATMTVTGPNATALIKAGRDYNSRAGQVRNEGEGGQTAILAGNNINLRSVRVGSSEQTRTGKDSSREAHSADVGSLVQGDGDVVLKASKDIVSIASTVDSARGTLYAEAKGDVLITHGAATDEYESATRTKNKRAFGSKTTETYDHVTQTTAQGSSWGGKNVVVQGENVTVQGSIVVSDSGTLLHGRNDVSVVAATNTLESTHNRKVKKSGVFSDGGVGFSIGSQKVSSTGEAIDTTHTGSVVGSVDGKTTIYANKHYQQTGSDVLGGDGVLISGATVAIENVENSMVFREQQKTSSGGIHISLKGGAADQAAAAYQGARAAGQAQDGRLKALYAVKAANELSTVSPGAIADQAGNAKDVVNGDRKANGNGISLRIGIGGSSSSSQNEGRTTTSQGSNIYSANGDVSVVAREGDLVVAGSKVDGINTTLTAADKLILLSGNGVREFREKNKSQSGEVGITLGSEAGFGIYASAAMAKGKGSGNGVSHDETVIGSGRGTTTFISAGDTVGIGAQIIGHRVIGRVGGDLILRSEQDTNDYHRKDTAAGFDGAIGTGGGSFSGYVNASKVDSTYRSVIEQTGVQAGAGGIHLDVIGTTTLDGAVIASTADPSNNYFHTGSLKWTDIVNEAKFKATQASVSGGGGSSGGGGTGSFQQKSGSATSITHAGIASGKLIVDDGSGEGIQRGVTQLQQDGLKEIFDARKVAEQLQIQQVAGELGFQAAGTLAEKNGWTEGSKEKVALHAAVGAAVAALGGGNVLGGAAGAGLNQSLVPVLRKAIENAGVKEGDNPATFNALMQAASLAVGGAAGGASGASTALAGDVNNRQLHPDEAQKLAQLKQGKSEDERQRLDDAMCALVRCSAGVPDGDPNKAQLIASEQRGQGYAEERALIERAGAFRGYSWTDSINDGLLRHDEAVMRTKGGARGITGAAGAVGATAGAAATTPLCATAVGCLAPVGLGGLAMLSAYDSQAGWAQALADYQSTQGQRVLDSFDPTTHWGPQNPLRNLGISAATVAAEIAIGKVGGYLTKGADDAPANFPAPSARPSSGPKESPSSRIDAPNNLLPDNINGDGLSRRFVEDAVRDVRAGHLPGNAIGGLGTPREMPQTVNPDEAAERFAMEFFGGSKPAHAKPLGDGAWTAKTTDGIFVTYRPAGKASAATKGTTASVNLNSDAISAANNGAKELKLKFPKTGQTGPGSKQ